MAKRIYIIGLYTLFFIVCLFFFVLRGFPVKLAADQMKVMFERELGIKITTSSLSVLFPNGVEATGLRLAKEGKEGSEGFSLLLDKARIRISLLGLLLGKRNISYKGELFSGLLDGAIGLEGERFRLDTTIEHIDLQKIPVWENILGVKLAGTFSGAIDVDLNPKDFRTTTGAIRIDLAETATGEGIVGAGKNRASGITIPSIKLGTIEVDLQLDKGKATIKTFRQQSDDLEAKVEGYVMLGQKFDQFSQNARVRFKPSAAFLTKNPKFLTVIELSGMNNAKDEQGYFSYKAMGLLSSPLYQPAKR